MNLYQETKYILEKNDIRPNKRLGQNFLIDEDALDVISSKVSKDDVVLEIGPGIGSLTKLLLDKAKKVICVELDPKMCEILNERFFLYENFTLIQNDILKVDLSQYIEEYGSNLKVVANLPYYITTSIITELLKAKVNDITILIQKEVADRICCKPGEKEAGAITYMVYYYADAEVLTKVPKESFIPNPEVESEVVHLRRLEKPRVEVKNEELFFQVIKENFSKRRKTITNSITNTIPKDKLEKILNEIGIDSRVRGEDLTIEEFAKIVNMC